MKAFFSTLLLTTILCYLSFAQPAVKLSTNPTSQVFKYLLRPNSEIAANDTINEAILDLVQPMVLDSVLGRKKEHHQVFLVGWLIHAFGGYNWRAINMTKEKFVGTVAHDGRSGGFEYTEWDIKFHLQFHLDKYLSRICNSYDCQRKAHKQDVRRGKYLTNYKVPPFVRDTSNLDIKQYEVGCELTPPPAFIPQLHYLFYPTLPNMRLREHPNFGTDHPSMGMYGANCLDCNHNCHPEIHPYEWIWWLNLSKGNIKEKIWLVGLFHEGSNRFKHWSKNPKTGKISIPFAFSIRPEKGGTPGIKVEHLVFNKFVEDGLQALHLPDSLISCRHRSTVTNFVTPNGASYGIKIEFDNVLPTDGLKYWFSDVNWDEKEKILSGFLNMAVSVQDLYTTRITFK